MACTIKRTLTDAEKSEIFRLSAEGMSTVRISVVLDIQEGYVRKAVAQKVRAL